MPTDRPNAAELVEAVREFLTDQVTPAVAGQLAFHVRVAANALGIVERTLAEGTVMDAAEQARLTDLLGQDGDLGDQNRVLAERIRAGDLDDQRTAVLDHLRRTAHDKVRLANPRYLTPRD